MEETYEEDGLVTAETDSALKILFEDSGEEIWVPRSQLLDGTEVEKKKDSGQVVIPEWLARKEGLV